MVKLHNPPKAVTLRVGHIVEVAGIQMEVLMHAELQSIVYLSDHMRR